MAFNFNTFMNLVTTDNPTFKRFSFSSDMDKVIKELKGKAFITPADREKLEKLVAFIPHDKQVKKYSKSLAYLTKEGGVKIGAIPANPIMKFTEFLIMKGCYDGWNSAGASKKGILLFGDPGQVGVSSYLHRHVLSWGSSNGNIASLANVWTREHVKFLANTQAPPFNAIQDPDREFYQPQHGGTVGGTTGTDDHSTKLPSLICAYPRVAGTLRAEQWYQYSSDSGLTWNNIDGAAYLIEKTVRKEGNDWVFIFKKTNWQQYNSKRFHFEVHYTIDDPPEYTPRIDTDVDKGMTYVAKIEDYARKVVSLG